jgi:hypothetical protein
MAGSPGTPIVIDLGRHMNDHNAVAATEGVIPG